MFEKNFTNAPTMGNAYFRIKNTAKAVKIRDLTLLMISIATSLV
jgi:hypothetical protein